LHAMPRPIASVWLFSSLRARPALRRLGVVIGCFGAAATATQAQPARAPAPRSALASATPETRSKEERRAEHVAPDEPTARDDARRDAGQRESARQDPVGSLTSGGAPSPSAPAPKPARDGAHRRIVRACAQEWRESLGAAGPTGPLWRSFWPECARRRAAQTPGGTTEPPARPAP
jgi:hypothetical protein